MVQLTFYNYAQDAPSSASVLAQEQPGPDDVHALRHGYNLADLEGLTRFAMRRTVGGWTDVEEMHSVAWSAIAEHLYAAPADEPPATSDLVAAGQRALQEFLRLELRHHGREQVNRRADGVMPRFILFWDWTGRPTPSPEARIVEQEALWQILPLLTPGQRDVVHALATHGSYQAAAFALDLTYKAFTVRLHFARRRFFELWLEGETPRQGRVDRRVGRARPARTHCSEGHELTPENITLERGLRDGRRTATRRCATCNRERARKYTRQRNGGVTDAEAVLA